MTVYWHLLSFPIALGAGWVWGHFRRRQDSEARIKRLSKEYFEGLNYLLNEQPDKAVDVFVKLLEVDPDTVETHLALGNLFRRRGEVDRAIRIHQNLIARPALSKFQRIEALLALGQDYMRAGVFDRAERLFLEVVDTGAHSEAGLRYLLDIYQQEKDWQNAINTARRLESLSGQDMSVNVAHYCCELAKTSKAKGQLEQTEKLLKKALGIDRNCVRASLLLGNLLAGLGQFKQAIRTLKRVKQQDPDYLSEALVEMGYCFEQLGDEAGFEAAIRECLSEFPRTSLVLLMSERLQKTKGKQFAAEFVAEQLRQRSSIRGLDRLIELHLALADDNAREDLMIIKSLTTELIENRPIYRCEACGFSSKGLHWQCPSCKRWSTIKVIGDNEVIDA